jgi:hypothetical protein
MSSMSLSRGFSNFVANAGQRRPVPSAFLPPPTGEAMRGRKQTSTRRFGDSVPAGFHTPRPGAVPAAPSPGGRGPDSGDGRRALLRRPLVVFTYQGSSRGSSGGRPEMSGSLLPCSTLPCSSDLRSCPQRWAWHCRASSPIAGSEAIRKTLSRALRPRGQDTTNGRQPADHSRTRSNVAPCRRTDRPRPCPRRRHAALRRLLHVPRSCADATGDFGEKRSSVCSGL